MFLDIFLQLAAFLPFVPFSNANERLYNLHTSTTKNPVQKAKYSLLAQGCSHVSAKRSFNVMLTEPRSWSGLLTTADSATAGCSIKALSTSNGPILYLEEFSILLWSRFGIWVFRQVTHPNETINYRPCWNDDVVWAPHKPQIPFLVLDAAVAGEIVVTTECILSSLCLILRKKLQHEMLKTAKSGFFWRDLLSGQKEKQTVFSMPKWPRINGIPWKFCQKGHKGTSPESLTISNNFTLRLHLTHKNKPRQDGCQILHQNRNCKTYRQMDIKSNQTLTHQLDHKAQMSGDGPGWCVSVLAFTQAASFEPENIKDFLLNFRMFRFGTLKRGWIFPLHEILDSSRHRHSTSTRHRPIAWVHRLENGQWI